MANACPMPKQPDRDEAESIRRMLAAMRIAVVGLSDDPSRPSHYVSKYLLDHGKQIIPVNPGHETVLGLKCYASLKDVPGKIDVVNVFRRPGFCAAITRQAIEIGAIGVWLQSGITNEEARHLAEQAGLDFVQDRCIMVEYMRTAR